MTTAFWLAAWLTGAGSPARALPIKRCSGRASLQGMSSPDAGSRLAAIGMITTGPWLGYPGLTRIFHINAHYCVSACNVDPLRQGIGVQI